MENVTKWVNRAQIRYDDYYISLYIAYNAWYRQVTRTTNDREALERLKKRFIIWDEYYNGHAMASLKVYFSQLVEFTQRQPLRTDNTSWSGELAGIDDWRSLIEFWYQVRCIVVHGSDIDETYVYLAYQTLGAFMNEIMSRINILNQENRQLVNSIYDVDMQRFT